MYPIRDVSFWELASTYSQPISPFTWAPSKQLLDVMAFAGTESGKIQNLNKANVQFC